MIWVESTSAATEVRGGDGDDVILVTPEAKGMSLANNLLVEGGPGVDGLAIHDQNNPYTFGGGHHYNVTPLSVSRTHGYFVAGGGFVVGMTDVDYKHVEILTVYAGQQADMVSATPSVKTSYWILGGDPDAGTGDTIDIDTGNLINPDFDPFPGSTNGILQSDLHGDVTFSQFETVHGLGLLPIESAGYTASGAADADSPFEPNVQEIVPTHAVVALSPSEMRRLPIDESVSSEDEFLRAIDSVMDKWEHFSDDLLLEVRLDGLTLD